MDLRGKRILVTGAGGFLGRHVMNALWRRDPTDVFAPTSAECDLRDASSLAAVLGECQPHLVIHSAGKVGGIGANQERPGEFFYENALMGLNVLEQSRLAGVNKVVAAGTICAYPKFTPVPMRESDLWSGYPEETNAPFGLASKMLLVGLQAYRRQYGLNGVFLLLVNMYGPHDNFDERSSHVLPALMRRCLEARQQGRDVIAAWGSGQATREFLYVEDAAEAVVLAAERYDEGEPINLGGHGGEISIARLFEKVAAVCGYTGRVTWDASRPDGQPRRMLDSGRARERLGWVPTTPLEEGLRATLNWYLSASSGVSPREPSLVRRSSLHRR